MEYSEAKELIREMTSEQAEARAVTQLVQLVVDHTTI